MSEDSTPDDRPRWRWPELIWPADRDAVAEVGSPVHLRGGYCDECERVSFPFGGACDWCGAPVLECRISDEGAVAGHTEVLLDTPGSAIPAPYRVALVRFDDVDLDILGLTALTDRPLQVDQPMRVVTTRPFDTDELHFAFEPTASERP